MEAVSRDLKQAILFNVENKKEELKSTLVKSVKEMISKQTSKDAARQSTRSDNRSSHLFRLMFGQSIHLRHVFKTRMFPLFQEF